MENRMSTVNRVKKRGKVTYNPVEPVECGTKKFRMHARRFQMRPRGSNSTISYQTIRPELKR